MRQQLGSLRLLRVLFGLGLLALLFYVADWRQAVLGVASADKVILLLALPLTPVAVGLRAYKFQLLLRASHIRLPLAVVAGVWLKGFFVGALTPSKVGELARAYFVATASGAAVGPSISATVADRLLDMSVLLVVGIVTLFFIPALSPVVGGMGWAWVPALVLTSAVAVALLLWLTANGLSRLIAKGGQALEQHLGLASDRGPVTCEVQKASWLSRSRCSLLSLAAALTLSVYAVQALQGQLLFTAQQTYIGFGYVFAFLCLGMIVGSIPVTISGIGTREWALVALFALVGVPAATTLSMSLLLFAIVNVPMALSGWLLIALGGKRASAPWTNRLKAGAWGYGPSRGIRDCFLRVVGHPLSTGKDEGRHN